MRVYLLDRNGTLNTLADPLGYVKALQAAGHKACLYSGGSFSHEKDLFNEVARQCDDVISKGALFNDVEERCSDWGTDLKFVAAEDDFLIIGWTKQFRPLWRIVLPENLLTDLESINAE